MSASAIAGGATWLLDTNALSEPAKPRPSAVFLRHFTASSGRLAVAATTWHEALHGLARLAPGRRHDAVREYLHDVVRPSITVLPYDEPAASWHALERARLEAVGRPPPFADGQIAAVAATRGLVLVTRNRKDFSAFGGLTIEDWWA